MWAHLDFALTNIIDSFQINWSWKNWFFGENDLAAVPNYSFFLAFLESSRYPVHWTTLPASGQLPYFHLGKVSWKKVALLLDFVQMRGGRVLPKFFVHFSQTVYIGSIWGWGGRGRPLPKFFGTLAFRGGNVPQLLKDNLNCRLPGMEHGELTVPALLCQRPDHQVPDGHHSRELH